MHWKETLIKSSDIKWKHHLKSTDDGRLDFDLHLPLTELFKKQAQVAMLQGMMNMLMFYVDAQKDGNQIGHEDLAKLFTDCGFRKMGKKMLELTEK